MPLVEVNGGSMSDVCVQSPHSMRVTLHTLLLAIVLIHATAFRLLTLDRPFSYDAEGSCALNGVLARNYLRFDWARTLGMPVLSSGPAGSTPPVFYPDHPPMLPLLIVPFYWLFGVGHWQTRFPISIITIITIVVVYRLLAAAATPRAGLIGAALFAVTPMTLYFGGFADVVGMPLICCVLLTLFAYLNFHRAPGFRSFAMLLAAFGLAALCDWPAYVVVPVLTLHFLGAHPRKEWPLIAAFAVAASVLFGATYIYIMLVTHNGWNWMVPLITRRSAIVGHNALTLGQWLGDAVKFNRTYHTIPLLLVFLCSLPALGFGVGGGRPLALLLLGWVALYGLIGGKALSDHEWAWMPLTPAIAVVTAVAIDWMLGEMNRRASWVAGLLVVVFASYTSYTTLRDLYPTQAKGAFTPMEIGQAIQVAAPNARDVALVFGDDTSAQLWWYGDRPLRTNVWSVDGLRRRLDDDIVDLVFDFDQQPWQATATGFVFPRADELRFDPLYRYLSSRYQPLTLPPALAGKFDVFDLRHPVARRGTIPSQ